MTDTALLNRPSQNLVEHLKRTRVLYLKEADAAEAAGVKLRMLDATLADALELGVIARKRLGRDIVYMLPDPQPDAGQPAPTASAPKPPAHTVAVAAQPAPAAPSAAPMPDLRPLAQRIEQQAAPVAHAVAKLAQAASPKGAVRHHLPAIDITKVEVTYEPLADGRVVSSESKWDRFFEALAQKPLGDAKAGARTFPTMAFPPSYGKAMQSAARKWSKRHAPLKIRVMASASECKVQRVA